MKVLNLQCSQQHSFEGWFGSEDDFQGQLARGLVECPLCADTGIQKLPSAPRLNLGSHSSAQAASAGQGSAAAAASGVTAEQAQPSMAPRPAGFSSAPDPAMQAAFLKVMREVVAQTEDVGAKFADEARRMHYGETENRGIRGQASVRETVELLEEGIEVMPLPLLPALKETLQ